jgi:hypothetical protein
MVGSSVEPQTVTGVPRVLDASTSRCARGRFAAFQLPSPRHGTRSGDARIAYQIVGDGDLDLGLLPGALSHVEHQWEEPSFARFLHRLAAFVHRELERGRGREVDTAWRIFRVTSA